MHRPLAFVLAPRIDGAPVSRSGTTLQLEVVLIGGQVEFRRSRCAVDQASREILDDVAKRGVKTIAQPAEENKERIDLTAKEQKQYSITRAIMTTCANIEASASSWSQAAWSSAQPAATPWRPKRSR